MRTTVLLLLATLHAASFSPPAGPSIFSDAVIQPQPVPATGGEVSVSAVLSDPAGVTAGWVQLRYTDGDEQRVALTRQSGTATQGTWGTTFSAKPNFADFGHYPSLVFTAKNASGVYSRSENIQLRQAGRNPAGPRIAISSVPAYLSSECTKSC